MSIQKPRHSILNVMSNQRKQICIRHPNNISPFLNRPPPGGITRPLTINTLDWITCVHILSFRNNRAVIRNIARDRAPGVCLCIVNLIKGRIGGRMSDCQNARSASEQFKEVFGAIPGNFQITSNAGLELVQSPRTKNCLK